MPKTSKPWRGDNLNPKLELLKCERTILENAAGLCESIAQNVEGYNVEYATQARRTKELLLRMAVKETDLTKPF